MYKLIIIGGGASGLCAAISAASQGRKVLIIEKMDRIGKKILATGNGRCNLFNINPTSYYGDDNFAQSVLSQVPVSQIQGFFESLGLTVRIEAQGRVYPASGQASSVLDVLRAGCERLNINIICNTAPAKITKQSNIFIIHTNNGQFECERILIAGGGKASPKLGSDGSGYHYLTQFGHRLIAPRPALSPIQTETMPIRGLSGIRIQANIKIKDAAYSADRDNKSNSIAEEGEILFTDYGISGIPAMAIARHINKNAILSLCLLPAINIKQNNLWDALMSRRAYYHNFNLEHYFTGLMHKRLGAAILRRANIAPLSRLCNSLSDSELKKIYDLLISFELQVTGVRGFDQAQVTAGGIDTKEFDEHTMASRLVPGLYASGEILNIDGPCGGYNLAFAFASGILAGRQIKG